MHANSNEQNGLGCRLGQLVEVKDGLNNSMQAMANARRLQLLAFSAKTAELNTAFRVACSSVGLGQQHLPQHQTHSSLRPLQIAPHQAPMM